MDHLDEILKSVQMRRAQDDPVLVIFDLDSTLFDLTLRQTRIVESFIGSHESTGKFRQELDILKEIKLLPSDWGLRAGLGRLGLGEATHPEFFFELMRFWSQHFFSNKFLLDDRPLPGAVQYVQELHRLGAEILYLTGRDEKRMGAGTVAGLRHWQFPLAPPEAQLVLKPKAGLDDAEFKVEEIRRRLGQYRKIWLFENEPVNLNRVYAELPEVALVLLETTHSGLEEPHPDIVARVPHFTVHLNAEAKSPTVATHTSAKPQSTSD